MGQCGCGDETPNVRFPGPEGVTYALEIYSSCHYCHTPAAVTVYRIADDSEYAEMMLEDAPEAAFVETPEVYGSFSITVLSAEHLKAALADEEMTGDPDAARIDLGTLAYALPDAVWRTLAEWQRMASANDSKASS